MEDVWHHGLRDVGMGGWVDQGMSKEAKEERLKR